MPTPVQAHSKSRRIEFLDFHFVRYTDLGGLKE